VSVTVQLQAVIARHNVILASGSWMSKKDNNDKTSLWIDHALIAKMFSRDVARKDEPTEASTWAAIFARFRERRKVPRTEPLDR